MRSRLIEDLASCGEFRQALQARPPRFVHGTALLLVALLGTALVWASLTEADLVVRAPGRVRPPTSPHEVKTETGGRVAKVYVHEGERVKKGDLLVAFDTVRLDNDILRKELTIRAGERELAADRAKLVALGRKFDKDRDVSANELKEAENDAKRAGQDRDWRVRRTRSELETAKLECNRLRDLVQRGGTSKSEWENAQHQVTVARVAYEKAQEQVSVDRVDVLRSKLEQLPEAYEVSRQEAEARLAARQGEVEAGRKELDNLRRDRDQAFLHAPADGVVISEDVKEGTFFEAGKVVVEIAEQAGLRFEAQVPSEEMENIRVGMPVHIKLDPFDYQKYGTLDGTVVFVAEDSRAVEGRGVFYVVKIAPERDEVGRGVSHARVKLGMTGRAEIVTERESLLKLLVKKVRQTISLG